MLRGMYMHPDRMRQGIGSGLLAHIKPILADTESYCIPGAHLLDFYGQADFRQISFDAAPGFLVERIRGYLDEGKDVVIMHRATGL